MFTRLPFFRACAAALLFTLVVLPSASAQNYSNTARSFVHAPQVLAMGGAAAAFGGHQTVFFYNPAKMAHIGQIKPKINLLGARTSFSTSVFDQLRFYRDEVSPRLETGLYSDVSPEGVADLQAFYEAAIEQGRAWASGNADVLLPSVMMRVAMVGVGGGLFSETHTRYRIDDSGMPDPVTGTPVPQLEMAFQSDQIAVVSAGVNLSRFGLFGLSAGLTGKYTHRHYGASGAPLHVLNSFSDEVLVPLFRGSSVGVDLGLLYEIPLLPGDLRAGLTIYDALASDYNYEYLGTLLGAEENVIPDVEALFIAEAAAYQPAPSVRLGAAYLFPTALLPFVDETGVAIDYVGQRRPFLEDLSFWRKLHMGFQAEVAILAVRTGVSEGHPTWGAGLHLGPLHFDYASYGNVYGGRLSNAAVRNHTLQLRLGL